jgi:lysophospholipase L1-like esterase
VSGSSVTSRIPAPLPETSWRVVDAQVSAIGDSVMLGAAYSLARVFGAVDIDAAVGRQPWSAVAVLQEHLAAGTLANVVIIHVGNNGQFTAGEFDAMMRILGSQRRVLVLNVNIPRAWEESNNAMLAASAPRYPNVTLIDWYGLSSDQPDLFHDDKVHLTPTGAAVYANFVASHLH